MKTIKVHAQAYYHLVSQCIYPEETYSDVFRIEISTNSASLMPPMTIISSTKNYVLCCQRLISYSFWSEWKSWISGAPVLPLRPIMLVFIFFLRVPDGEIGHARGGLKVISLLPRFVQQRKQNLDLTRSYSGLK